MVMDAGVKGSNLFSTMIPQCENRMYLPITLSRHQSFGIFMVIMEQIVKLKSFTSEG